MKRLFGCLLCTMLLAFGAQAHALLIDADITSAIATGPEWNMPDIYEALNDGTDPDYPVNRNTLLYKFDLDDDTESGLLAGNYNSWFSESQQGDGWDGGEITYVSGNYVGGSAYLLVKDGNNNPAWFLYDLTVLEWNGIDVIELQNFWTDVSGAISNVSLYGTSVPEPATMLLLGTGLIGFVGISRKKLFKR